MYFVIPGRPECTLSRGAAQIVTGGPQIVVREEEGGRKVLCHAGPPQIVTGSRPNQFP